MIVKAKSTSDSKVKSYDKAFIIAGKNRWSDHKGAIVVIVLGLAAQLS